MYCRPSSLSITNTEYSNNQVQKSVSSSPVRATQLKISHACHVRRHNHSDARKRKVTIVLIVCLCVALTLWTPQSLSLTYETFVESYPEMTNERRIVLLIFNNFANLFLCINASIDFILYCFLSENFARTCKQIVRRQCSNYYSKCSKGSRKISFYRTSFNSTAASNNVHQIQHQHQQGSAAVRPMNRHQARFFLAHRRNSSDLKIHRASATWRKRFAESTSTAVFSSRTANQQVSYQAVRLRSEVTEMSRREKWHSVRSGKHYRSTDLMSQTENDLLRNETDASLLSLINYHRQVRADTIATA